MNTISCGGPRGLPKVLAALVGMACLALSTPMAQAAGQGVLGGAQAGVGQLRYSLIDLDPTDGVAPSISFNSAIDQGVWLVDVGELVDREDPVAGGFFAGGSTVVSTNSGRVQMGRVGPGEFLASTQVHQADLDEPLLSRTPMTWDLTALGVVSSLDGSDRGAEWSWSLSANTALVVEGLLTGAIDDAGMTAAAASGLQGFYARNTAWSGAALMIDGDDSWIDSAESQLVRAHALTAGGLVDLSPDAHTAFADTFVLRVDNTGTGALRGVLAVQMEASTYLMVHPTAPAVPEPHMLALVLAGLPAAAWGLRHRRA